MKKIKLFLAAMAAMVTMSAQAQLTDGTVYWIQDVSSGQFISQGADWGTQGTVKTVGGVGLQAVYVSDGVYKFMNVMWNTVNGQTDKGMRASDRFLDQAAGEWTLTASGEGYLIKNADNEYLCNNGTENKFKVKPLGVTTDVTAATVWKFLTKTEYDAALVAYKDASATAIATAKGLTASSVADLETIISNTNSFVIKDLTSRITNASLATSWDGWSKENTYVSQWRNSVDNGTYVGVGDGCAEFWSCQGCATQTVTGLPNGIYKLEFAGTFRPKDKGNSEKLTSGQTSSPAFVYANDYKVEFIHWIDVSARANGRSGINATDYANSLYTYVSDGTLTIGIVQDAFYDGNEWCPFGQFKLTYYNDQMEDDDIAALIATIPVEGTIPASVYSNLTSLKNTLESTKTIAAYNALTAAITSAQELVAPYATLLTEIAKAKALGIDANDADAYADIATAAEATANTQALMVGEYTYVVDNYTTAIELGAWTISNAGDMHGQHWDGTSTTPYNEQKDGLWASNTTWETSYIQEVTLPAGEYVFKVAGRHSQYSTLTLSVTSGGTTLGEISDFPVGDTGRGINTSGVTDFATGDGHTYANGGNGRGWQWRYVPFTLNAETAVTIKVEGGNPEGKYQQWVSFCNYTVQAKPNVAASRAAYAQAVANANTALAASTYANVGGTDRSNLEDAINETPTETVEWYDAQTTLIQGYTTTFTAGVASWDAYATTVLTAKDEADNFADGIYESLNLTAPATASEASTAATNAPAIRVATANYVASNYQYSLTSKIGDFSTWTRTATYNNGNGSQNDTPQTRNEEHWSGVTRDYYEQGINGWGASNGFTATYTKIADVPVGDYVIKVAARAANGVTGTISATATGNTVVLPAEGAYTRGINTDGEASWSDSDTFARGGDNNQGFGWQWRFLPFSVTTPGEVTITIYVETTGNQKWFSLADAELLSAADLAEAVAYDDAVSNTIVDVDVANVTITRNVKVGFNTVVLPFDLTAGQVAAAFGTGTNVYAFSESSESPNDATVNFNKVNAGTISANVPVLVNATVASNTQEFKGVHVVAPTADVKVEGTNFDFVGLYEPLTAIPEGDYFIGNGALYKSAGSTSMKAFRAYIKAKSGASGVKLYIDGEDIETSIEEINGEATEVSIIYNLAGQRISKMQKGINIVNGKKVLF